MTKQQQREQAILDHIREHGSTLMKQEERARMVGMPHTTFARTVQSFVNAGTVRTIRSMHGSRLAMIEGEPEPTAPMADRVRCPRCETVNCERHTASHLTTGRISPVYR